MRAPLTEAEKTALLRFARQSLQAAVQGVGLPFPDPQLSSDRLRQPGASFVTLTKQGMLRGCIGGLQARMPLDQDVIQHAAAAALDDYRFPPVQPSELKDIHIEISVLSDPVPLEYRNAQDLIAKLRPGMDGVILTRGLHRATFLPQVWEKAPHPEAFLSLLCEKAGLAADAWRRGDLEVLTYQVESLEEMPATG
jgi:AmmeMemoRadiSam system protein A